MTIQTEMYVMKGLRVQQKIAYMKLYIALFFIFYILKYWACNFKIVVIHFFLGLYVNWKEQEPVSQIDYVTQTMTDLVNIFISKQPNLTHW